MDRSKSPAEHSPVLSIPIVLSKLADFHQSRYSKYCQTGQNKNNLVIIKAQKADVIKSKSLNLGYINSRSVRNKTTSINSFIVEQDLDMLAITETWLHEEGDEATIKEMLPEGFSAKHEPRKNQS